MRLALTLVMLPFASEVFENLTCADRTWWAAQGEAFGGGEDAPGRERGKRMGPRVDADPGDSLLLHASAEHRVREPRRHGDVQDGRLSVPVLT